MRDALLWVSVALLVSCAAFRDHSPGAAGDAEPYVEGSVDGGSGGVVARDSGGGGMGGMGGAGGDGGEAGEGGEGGAGGDPPDDDAAVADPDMGSEIGRAHV